MNDSDTFGSRLREARKALKLTQKQLGERIGAKHNSVSDWENDKNMPDPDTIVRLCEALRADPGYLLMNTQEQPTAPNNITDIPLSDRALKVARAYDQMSGYGKAIIDAIITQENLHRHIFIANVRNDLVLDGTGRWEVKASAISEQCEPETDDDFRYPSKQESDVRVLE